MSISVQEPLERATRTTTATSRREATARNVRIGLTDAMRSFFTMTSENRPKMKKDMALTSKTSKTVLEQQEDEGISLAVVSSNGRC